MVVSNTVAFRSANAFGLVKSMAGPSDTVLFSGYRSWFEYELFLRMQNGEGNLYVKRWFLK